MVVNEVVLLPREKFLSCRFKPTLFYFPSIVAGDWSGLSYVSGRAVFGCW